jgi:hypothetical protein
MQGLLAAVSSADAVPEPRRLTRVTQPLKLSVGLPDCWARLYAQEPSPSIFVSPQWMMAWLDVYGHHFSGEWIQWQCGAQTVGAVLVVWRTVWVKGVPLRTGYLNATGYVEGRSPETEFNEVLHLPAHAPAICADLAAYLNRLRLDRVVIAAYEPSPFFAQLIAALGLSRREDHIKPSPYIDLLNLQGRPLGDVLNSKGRLHMRQAFTRYAEVYGELVLDEAADEAARNLYFEELSRLHNAVWDERGKLGAFACEEFTQFHKALLRSLGGSGSLRLLRICAGTQPIGYLQIFASRGHAYVYQSGFSFEKDAKLRPGFVAHALAAKHFGALGFTEYSLMAGDSQYKRTLAKERRSLNWTTLYRNTPMAWAYIALRGIKRKFKPLANQADVETA